MTDVATQISERVKSLDLHPTEPWILTSLYSGSVSIWNFQSHAIVKTCKVTDSPVRSAKFIAQTNWIITGSDDKFIRVLDFNTMEIVREFEAHTDYIRCLIVHPTLPYVVSCSDDKLVKLWDWEKEWTCTRVFEQHEHYVMQVVFNPIEPNIFASASLDGTIKVWNLDSPTPVFTLEGHSKGVNCVDFLQNGDKLYILSGSDDYTVKVWDSKSRSCVRTLEGHEHNVTSICIHPRFPIVITCCENEIVRVWNANTFGLENTLNAGLDRVWAASFINDSNECVFGCDKGMIVLKITHSNFGGNGGQQEVLTEEGTKE